MSKHKKIPSAKVENVVIPTYMCATRIDDKSWLLFEEFKGGINWNRFYWFCIYLIISCLLCFLNKVIGINFFDKSHFDWNEIHENN